MFSWESGSAPIFRPKKKLEATVFKIWFWSRVPAPKNFTKNQIESYNRLEGSKKKQEIKLFLAPRSFGVCSAPLKEAYSDFCIG